jgi:hypothetical protein
MNINSPNDLYRFLAGNGLSNICPETQNLVACMNVLSRMCSCDTVQAKQAKVNECSRHYVAFSSKAGSFSAELLQKANDNKINFYLNNQLIGSIHR